MSSPAELSYLPEEYFFLLMIRQTFWNQYRWTHGLRQHKLKTQLSFIKNDSPLRKVLLRFHPYFIYILSHETWAITWTFRSRRLEAASRMREPQLHWHLGSRAWLWFCEWNYQPPGSREVKVWAWESVAGCEALGRCLESRVLIRSPCDPGDQVFFSFRRKIWLLLFMVLVK